MGQLLKKFTRVTSTGTYLPEIDGLRFLAILWVFVYHLNYYLGSIYPPAGDNLIQTVFGNGHFGVELFFVISGFVLSLPFARYYLKDGKKVSLRQYFIRRLTRLEPPYFLIMIFLFVFLASTQLYTAKGLTPHLLASLLYVHNIIYPGMLPVINPVAWSLEIEIQFYLMVPLLAYIFILKKNTRRILLALMMVLMPVMQYFYKSDILFFYQFLQYFVAGFLLADFYVTTNKEYFYYPANRIKRLLLNISGLLLLAAILMIHSTRTDLIYTIFIPFAVVVFYFIVLFIPFWKKVFSTKWMTIIGGMSYTIYLLHLMVISTLGRFFVNYKISANYFINFMVQFFILGSLTIIASSLFFYFIERPCMKKDWHITLYRNITSRK